MPDGEVLDAQAAAALVEEASARARRQLRVRLPLVYAAWGGAWLVGLGAMWLSVRGQHPYHGPSALAGAILGALLVAALAVTGVVVTRATRGVGGASTAQRRLYGSAWLAGFGALFAIEGALARHGASPGVMGVLSAAGPLLVTGLIYLLAAAIWLDWSMAALGGWLVLVGAAGAWAGPVAVLLIGGLAGGGGFLVTAAVVARRHPA